MKFKYKTKGTCSDAILFEIDDNKVHNVQFVGGCSGNTQGVSRLIEGMDVIDEIVAVERDGSDKPLQDQKMKKVEVDTKGFDYPAPVTQK